MSELKLVGSLPQGQSVVAICEFKGMLIVALTCGVYRLEDGKLVMIEFEDAQTKT